MKKYSRRTIIWIVMFILMLSFGLAACSGLSALASTGGEPLPPEIDVDDLLEDTEKGVVVTHVDADSPAKEAGLMKGDVILMIGDQEVNTVTDVWDVLENYQEGDKVQLTLRRGVEIIVETVELGQSPGHAYLGVSVCCGGTLITTREGEFFGGKANALILQVVNYSPAEEAGLEMGDLILSVDGRDIDLDTDLAEVIQGYQPGDTVKLEIWRDGQVQEYTVELGEDPDEKGVAYLGVRYQMFPEMGFVPREMMPDLHFQFDLQEDERLWSICPFLLDIPLCGHSPQIFTLEDGLSGVIVMQVVDESPAIQAGLEPHDVITALDGEPVEGMDEFKEAIGSHKPGDEVTLTIKRSGVEDEIEAIVILGEHPDKEGVGYLGVHLGGMIKTEVYGGDCCDEDWVDKGCEGPFEFHFDHFHEFEFPFDGDT